MRNVYKLAKTWQYLLIASSVGLFLIFLFPIFFGNISGNAYDFVWGAIIAGGISGLLSYGCISSKIVTSPEGIECISFGTRVRANWDMVEKVDINIYGFVNLVFKDSIFKIRWVNKLLRPLGYDRNIQLSPYIDNLPASNLLKDISIYAPNSNIFEILVENKRSLKPYQKVGTIGIYYLGWLLATLPLTFALRKVSEHLEITGFPNMTLLPFIMVSSLIIGLFFNFNSLLGYNAEISKSDENEIPHKARTYYIGPPMILLLGLITGLGTWAILQIRSISLSEDDYGMFAMVSVLIGIVALRLSDKVEMFLFKDKIT